MLRFAKPVERCGFPGFYRCNRNGRLRVLSASLKIPSLFIIAG